jgi:hypothetical protein
MGLVEGVKFVLGKFIESERQKKRVLPIRCFTQKPNMFYIYCGPMDQEELDGTQPTMFKLLKDSQHTWTSMSNADLEMVVDYMSQLYVREFLLWQRQNITEIEQDETRGEEQIAYMMRVNSMRPSKEKGMVELRKWLFATLEENAQNIAECEWGD